MNIKCPHCGVENEIDNPELGRSVKCQICRKDFIAETSNKRIHAYATVKQFEHIDWNKLEIQLKTGAKKTLGFVAKALRSCPFCSDPKIGDIMTDWSNTCGDEMPFGCGHYAFGGSTTGTPPKNTNEDIRRNVEREKLRAKLDKTYVCTHCGESTTSPRKFHNRAAGCFNWILMVLFILMLLIGAIPPSPIFIVVVIFLFTIGIICFATEGRKTVCDKCGKFNTLIPANTPQGARLLKELEDACRDDNRSSQHKPITPTPSPQYEQQDVAKRLEKARKLLDDGVISAEEYELQRKRILDSI